MHTDRIIGEPDGAFCANERGDTLTFACARCNDVISEPAALRNLFSARIDNHFSTVHGMEAWNIRNLDNAATEALSCIFDGQENWLHDFDHDER